MPRLTTTPTRRGDEGRDDYRRYKLTTENESTAQIPEPNRGADHILRGIVTITASNRRDYCYSLRAFCQTEKILC